MDGRGELVLILGKSWDGSQASALSVGAERRDDIARRIQTATVQSSSLPFYITREDLEPFFFAEGQGNCRSFFSTKSMTHLADMRFGVIEGLMRCLSTKPNRLGLSDNVTAARPTARVHVR